MKPFKILLPILALGVLMGSNAAQAAIIPVTNYSFENPVMPDGPPYDTTLPGWDPTGPGNAFIANPDSTSFNSPPGVPLTDLSGVGGDGQNALGLNNIASVTSHDAIDTVSSLQEYTLKVAVGKVLGTFYSPYLTEVGFKIGDQIIPGSTMTFNPNDSVPSGEFRDFTFKYTTSNADIGKSVKVFLSEQMAFGANLVAFDNVRVSVVGAPEPSTWAMMGLGMGALLFVARRRKRSTSESASALA